MIGDFVICWSVFNYLQILAIAIKLGTKLKSWNTLFINACAILNFKLKRKSGAGELFEDAEPSAADKIREFLINLRYFRIFIGVWNIILALLMFLVFSR